MISLIPLVRSGDFVTIQQYHEFTTNEHYFEQKWIALTLRFMAIVISPKMPVHLILPASVRREYPSTQRGAEGYSRGTKGRLERRPSRELATSFVGSSSKDQSKARNRQAGKGGRFRNRPEAGPVEITFMPEGERRDPSVMIANVQIRV